MFNYYITVRVKRYVQGIFKEYIDIDRQTDGRVSIIGTRFVPFVYGTLKMATKPPKTFASQDNSGRGHFFVWTVCN